jgi:DNA-binding transcriptional MerR regulator
MIKDQASPSYSLDQLAALSGLPRRTVRYYIQLGLVDRPIGETRAAHYAAHHLDQLLTVVKYSKAGLALDRIGELLKAPQMPPPLMPPRIGNVEVRSHLTLADGVELVVEPGRAGLSPEQVRGLFREVLEVYGRIVRENDDER